MMENIEEKIMEIGKIEFGPVTSSEYPLLHETIQIGGYKSNLKSQPIVKIWNKGSQPNPEYAHSGDAGMDIRADEDVELMPHETKIIKTGIHVKIPVGYEIQVRPRSGQSAKTKMRVANSPGTIDSNYTGEICVICDNIGDNRLKINKGDRIAQIVLKEVPIISWQSVFSEEDLGETVRGNGGFGSTGNN